MKFQEYLKMKGQVNESRVGKINESYSYTNGEMLVENAGEEMLKYIKSMINYAVVRPAYEKLKEGEYDAKFEQEQEKLDFDEKRHEKLDQAIAKVKQKFKAQKDAITQNQNLDASKKKIEREKINATQENVVKGAETTFKDKIDQIWDQKKETMDAAIKKDYTDEITNLETDYPIEAELLKKQWQQEKLELDLKLRQAYDKKVTDIKLKAATDPEKQQEIIERQKERTKKQEQDAAEEAKELAAEQAELESKFNDKMNDTNASQEQKAALQTLKDFQTAMKEYPAAAKDAMDNPDDDAKKDASVAAKTKISDNKTKITAGLLIKAGMFPKDKKDEAEELAQSMTQSADTLIKKIREAKQEAAGGKSEKAKAEAAGFSVATETEDELKAMTVNVQKGTAAGNTVKKPEWKIKKIKDKDGATIIMKKKITYKTDGSAEPEGEDEITLDSRQFDFTGIDLFTEDVLNAIDNDTISDLFENIEKTQKKFNSGSRIVPTFESYMHSRGLK